MGMMQGITFLFIHVSVFLTVSFFVLVVARKQEARWLKALGCFAAICLWVSAGLVVASGLRGDRDGMMRPPHCPMQDVRRGDMQAPPFMMKGDAFDPGEGDIPPEEEPENAGGR